MDKKIFITGSFGKFGGTRTYFENLLLLLFENNFDVTVGLQRRDNIIIKNIEKYNFNYVAIPDENTILLKLRKIPIIRLLASLLSNIIEYNRIYKIIRNNNCKLAIYSDWVPNNRFGSFILLPLNKICVVHSYPVDYLRKSARWFLNKKIKKSDIILTVSEYSKKAIIKYWLTETNKNNCEVIYNGVDDKIIKDNNRNKKEKKILTIGHVEWYKNPFLWIEIAKKVINQYGNDIQFIWAGDGALLNECKNRIDQNYINNIQFIGYYSEVQTLYEEAILYFQPSHLESHGISVIDAMKNNIPSIVSDKGGLPESITDNEEGFVVSLNEPDIIVDKIGFLLNENEIRKEMGIKSRIKYENYFNSKMWKNNSLQLIKKINE